SRFSALGMYSIETDHILRSGLALLAQPFVRVGGRPSFGSAHAFSSDGTYLVTSDDRNIITVWDIGQNRERTHLTPVYAVESIAMSPDGQYVAAGSRRTAQLWDLSNDREVFRVIHTNAVSSVAISPDSRYLATASLDHTGEVWEIATHRRIARVHDA